MFCPSDENFLYGRVTIEDFPISDLRCVDPECKSSIAGTDQDQVEPWA